MRYIAMLLLIGGLSTTSAFSQSGITLQGAAGIGIPTDSDFSEAFKSGIALGGRFGYEVAGNIELIFAEESYHDLDVTTSVIVSL